MNTDTASTEQLAFEVTPVRVVVPLQFRISEATSRRGLAHIAQLRQLLAERQAAREGHSSSPQQAA